MPLASRTDCRRQSMMDATMEQARMQKLQVEELKADGEAQSRTWARSIHIFFTFLSFAIASTISREMKTHSSS